MRVKSAILVLFVFALFTVQAQNKTEAHKPKVGLVLSGGGAKGLAHIGALKVIDSLGIKIDYIAGTSMGAIIGGLYASGYSGKQLDSIFQVQDFDIIINDNLPRVSKTSYERDSDDKYAVKLPFDNYKIKLPSALSKGYNVYSLLLESLIHVNQINDFDKLPIPFFCIATDAETGSQIVLDQGDLARAILASGALPSVFQPVMIEDQLLIDGGVVNNYPVDELRAKGMDVIIGVDVQDGLRNREALASAPELLIQINNFRTIQDMKLKAQQTDIYIKPNIEDFNVVSFSDGDQIIKNGVAATKTQVEALSTLPRKTKNDTLSNLRPRRIDSLKINHVHLKGIDKYTRAYVLGKLKVKGYETLSYEKIRAGMDRLEATNNFDNIKYEFIKTEDNSGYDINVYVKETNQNLFLKLGIHYDDLYKSAALVNVTKKRLFFKNDVASFDFILGDNVRYNFEYLIDRGFYWSIGLKSRYNQFDKNINTQLLIDNLVRFDAGGVNKIDVKLKDFTNQFYVQTLFMRDFALTMGLEHKNLELNTETISEDDSGNRIKFENTNYLSLFGNMKLDTYNNKYFPKRGVYLNGDLNIYLLSSSEGKDFNNFSIAKANMGYAFSVHDKLAFNLQTSGGFKIGNSTTAALDFALGGYGSDLINNFIPFVGYDFVSLIGNSFVKASAVADYEIFKKHHITLEGNWSNVEDDIFETGEWFTLPDYRGYALGYGLETFLGPIQVKYSYSPEQKESTWFFNLGFWF
ncbi:patatin-like phospholipase family protein [Algibacter mikhailovii]|uniref:patatin-like phospholipase family protein n=1 Tax=Algibacter mikhailovii TaxID=425498 RepID=UPI0016785028|nr:patatin-like phospholipase family protein [Algibacter mikhailovii]